MEKVCTPDVLTAKLMATGGELCWKAPYHTHFCVFFMKMPGPEIAARWV